MTTSGRSVVFSVFIILVALGLVAASKMGVLEKKVSQIVVVAGSELQPILEGIAPQFQKDHAEIQIELQFQGSQDIVNRYLDDKNDFTPTILIPANGELLKDLALRWSAQDSSPAFHEAPRPLAKTLLVAVAWPDRGQVLFPDGVFRWERIEQAMKASSWQDIGGQAEWGSFDFVMTDPLRSNSGLVTLSLWSAAVTGGLPTRQMLNSPLIPPLFTLIHKGVYQPPRSTDLLLQEFITRGPNDADVAVVYESNALSRWQQAASSKGQPYQIYYFPTTIETTITAGIVRRGVDTDTAQAAQKFLDYLLAPEQQSTFVMHGFHPMGGGIDLQKVAGSPWNQNIPGSLVSPPGTALAMPEAELLDEILRLWSRSG